MNRQERFERLNEIIDQALDMEGEAREAFLTEVCADDPEMRLEIDSLLQEEQSAEGFLDTPIMAVGQLLGVEETSLADEGIPTAIGPYQVVRVLGEGGMGTVVLAEQTDPFKRNVALKLIQGLRTARRRKQFIAECRALARLNHPNICALYEAGAAEGSGMGSVPYVAMEYIDGDFLTLYSDKRKLTLQQRLDLFLQVCAGVQHAHEKGILHCDIKPGNILVGEYGGVAKPKIIDFGIARALDRDDEQVTTVLNPHTGIAGSPAYMSPEIIETGSMADLDTRADVYSLGMMLYELLLGVLPYQNRGESIWVRLKRRGEEDAPSLTRRWYEMNGDQQTVLADKRGTTKQQMERQLRGDLDAILSKALSRDRERRYNGPAELAMDLRRSMSHKPIRARKPSLAYVTGRLFRRHWRATALAALLFVSVIAGVVAHSMEARRTEEALAESQNLTMALLDILEIADPASRGDGIHSLDILQKGVKGVERNLADKPLVQARFFIRLGMLELSVGRASEAERVIRKALILRQDHMPPNSLELAECYDQLGIALRRQGNLDASLEAAQQALAIFEINDAPAATAQALNHLGNLHWARGEIDAAVTTHRKVIAIRQSLKAEPDLLAESLHNLGVALSQQGAVHWPEALEHLQTSHGLFTNHMGANHPRTVSAYFNMGRIQERLGNYPEAETIYRRSYAQWRTTYGIDHGNTRAAMRNLTVMLRAQLRHEELVAVGKMFLDASKRAGVPMKTSLDLRRRVAMALGNLGRFPEAERIFREHKAYGEQQGKTPNAETLRADANLVWLDLKGKRYQQALDGFQALLPMRIALSGADHNQTAWLRRQMAEAYEGLGRLKEAEAQYHQAIKDREALTRARSMADGNLLADTAKFLARHNSPDYRLHAQKAIDIFRTRQPDSSIFIQEMLSLLGDPS